jgi:cytochrome c oxidase subunit 3
MEMPPEPRAPADHFATIEQQDHAAHLGMWLFLTSEVLLFGALFALYAGYRAEFGAEFVRAAHHNDVTIGTANTLILITSSLCAAWAVHAIRRGHERAAELSLAAAVLLGLAFLGLKLLEYRAHFAHGIFPGAFYRFEQLPGHGAGLFFTLYFFMTGLHALHVIGGLCALASALVFVRLGRYTSERHVPLELSVLYWHLVDVIWIFLWPLLYLVG